jgi:TolB-like protein
LQEEKKMQKTTGSVFLVLLGILVGAAGCSYRQDFVKGEEIGSRARWAAVLPLVNLTSYPNAGRIVGDLLTTELYALTDFKIMERTEMLAKLKGEEDDLDEVLDRAVALKVGKQLGVDTVIFGSVTEYRYKRGLDEDPVVGINIRMLDVKSDKILWAGSNSGTGGCFWFCEDSLNRLAQKTCHDMVAAMLKEIRRQSG